MHTTGSILTHCEGCDDLQPRVARYLVHFTDGSDPVWTSYCEGCALDAAGWTEHISHIETVQGAAEDAFWRTIVQAYPSGASGDLDPATTMALTRAMEDAITAWVTYNVNKEKG
jgi:hypothetical protein